MINQNPDHSHSADPSASRSTVDIDQLIEQFSAACRGGENPSIEKYVNDYPQHADEIRDLFPSIQWMEQLKDVEAGERTQLASQSTSRHPDCIEDYQIVREIGRGGMGIVYEAFQKTLQRRVALKLLHDHAIPSPKRVARFAREARSAAGLHHSNIVPVFGFGQYGDNHYYAMQFIDGVTIDEVVQAMRLTLDESKTAGTQNESANLSLTNSSAISQANALRQGQYNRRRDIESESHAFSSFSKSETNVPVESLTQDEMQVNLTVVEDFENSATAIPGDDTFDLFQMTAEVSEASMEKAAADAKSNANTNDLVDHDPEEETFAPIPNLRLDALGKPYWTSIARLGFQVADALNYAHNCKVIHRDIKPSNLLLDAKGTVWVADFGLAKPIENDDLTRTGDTVGTLRYMSPEQISGSVDLRSDIYSLGLSLFELATLRQAFENQNHAQLFKSKTSGGLTSPRKLNPGIPRDLETIILKATAADPNARYQTAGKMAADLQLFLEDRPIQARRANAFEKFVRWSRRNPAVASLTGLAAVLLIAIAVVSSVLNFQTQSALSEATRAKSMLQKQKSQLEAEKAKVDQTNTELIAAKNQADQNLMLAMEAFEKIRNNLSARGRPISYELELGGSQGQKYTTTLNDADAELLDLLIPFYEQFASQNSDDLEIRIKKAEAQHHLGVIYTRLTDYEEAIELLRQALKSYEVLSRQHPQDEAMVLARARVLNDLCIAFNDDSDLSSSLHSIRKAKDLLTEYGRDNAETTELLYQLGQTLDLMGLLMIRSGMPELEIDNPQPRPGIGPGPRSERRNPIDMVRRDLVKAATIFRRLADEWPEDHRFLVALSRTQRHQLVFELLTDKTESASRHFENAVDNLDLLAKSFPNNPEYRFELADTLSLASTRLESIETAEEALEKIEDALKICKQLIDSFPNIEKYQLLEANCFRKMALVQAAIGNPNLSIAAFDRAGSRLNSLRESYPEIPKYQIHLTLNAKQKADTLVEFGKRKNQTALIVEGKNLLRQGIRDFQLFSARNQSPYYRRVMASLYESLSYAQLELGQFEEAAMSQERSQASSNMMNDKPFGWDRRFNGRFYRGPR